MAVHHRFVQFKETSLSTSRKRSRTRCAWACMASRNYATVARSQQICFVYHTASDKSYGLALEIEHGLRCSAGSQWMVKVASRFQWSQRTHFFPVHSRPGLSTLSHIHRMREDSENQVLRASDGNPSAASEQDDDNKRNQIADCVRTKVLVICVIIIWILVCLFDIVANDIDWPFGFVGRIDLCCHEMDINSIMLRFDNDRGQVAECTWFTFTRERKKFRLWSHWFQSKRTRLDLDGQSFASPAYEIQHFFFLLS